LDLQLPKEEEKDELLDWITKEFPIREVEFHGRIFTFNSDIPNSEMVHYERIRAQYPKELDNIENIQIMLQALSIEPKISKEAADAMGSEMLMTLWRGIHPKKASETSLPKSITNISLPVNSINNEVKSATGECMKHVE
jgi:hypothetical protein